MGVIADKIRKAIFGSEVRDSIADGIEVVEQLREDYDNQVINAGNSNAEIVDARGGHIKLKDRLDQVDSHLETIVTEYYLTRDTTLKEVVESMGEDGGCIYVSHGVHEVNEPFALDKKIVIRGHGHNCILKLNALIITDDDPLHTLEIDNVKIITNNNQSGIYFNKQATSTIFVHPTLSTDFILNKVLFYNEQENGGRFLNIKQACNSIISNCIFQNKTTNSNNFNGVEMISEGRLGVRNLSINSCRFVGLNYAIKAIGVDENYQYTCGIMVDSATLIMDCNYGIYAENVDWLSIENCMIDYCDYPIKTYNVSNLKVKNNYLFSRRKEISAACVEVVIEDKNERFFPEIIGNHMWNSSYGSLNEGIFTYGVHLKVIATNSNAILRSPLISKNTIHRVVQCVRLETVGKNGYEAKIEYGNIEGNQFYKANRGIFATEGIEKSIAPNNTFNSVIIDIESSSEIPLSNILSKELEVTLFPDNSVSEVATGIVINRIVGIELLYNDNVYTYDVSAYLKSNGNVICRKRNASYQPFVVKVLVKYNFSY